MLPQPVIPTPKSGPGQHALAYAALGWRVLPIKPGEKRPPMSAWQRAASIDPATVRSWFKDLYRGHGVGIATGEASTVWVLDVDIGPDKNGAESLAVLEAAHGPLPDTVEAVTGSGGRHLYFRWPTGRRVITRRDTGHTASPLPAGIDVRGEGGQVLAPPTVHPSGTHYGWRTEHSPWDRGVAEAPAWLLEIVCERAPEPPTSTVPRVEDDDSIAEWFNQENTWDALLGRSGWTAGQAFNNQQYWTRPNKDPREGHSAVLHLPDGPFVIFSTDGSLARFSQPWARTTTGDGWAFSRFGFHAADKHGGDRSETARQLRIVKDGPGTFAVETTVEEADEEADAGLPIRLDWYAVARRESRAEEYLVDDFWPVGRAMSIVSNAKAGKSTLIFYVAACLAKGIDPWTGRQKEPVTVGYWDMEMTEDDVHDLMVAFGFQPDELDRFRYYLLPDIPPLDTPEGGKVIRSTLIRDEVQATVFDTFSRVLEGDENEARTIQAYYRNTALHLKHDGISSLRLDHVGHQVKDRARGSSGKGADVDIAWVLNRMENNVTLDHHGITRVRGVEQKLCLTLVEGDPDVYRRSMIGDWPAGTEAAAKLLDRLGIPIDLGRPRVKTLLAEAGEGVRNDVLSAAIRYRKQTENLSRIVGDSSSQHLSRDRFTETASTQAGDRCGDSAGQVISPLGDSPPPLGGDSSPGPATELDLECPF